MAANSSVSLTSLDIPTLMADFRSYMQGQTAFKDYNFEGATVSALLRILAYNTYKNSFFLTMALSEGFLDTAQTLPAVLSHSKELNYTPRSARSAKASISFTFNGTEAAYVIPKGTTFTAVVKNTGLNFSFADSVLATSTNNFFTVAADIYEGIFQTDSFVVNNSEANQRFILSNQNVDTSSLSVMLYTDSDVTGSLFSLSTSLLDIDNTSKVYFLQATGNGSYEVIFGDGVSGYKPPDGSTAVFDYRITTGENGNGARQFSVNKALGVGVSNVSPVYTVSESTGGSAMEDIESIRYYAPRHFQIQERAVVADDYSTLLKMNFPEIRTASAIGGEDLVPPRYGCVVIAVDISDVDGIPTSKQNQYASFLQSRCGLTVRPIIIEPDYTYVAIRSKVFYNLNLTTLTPTNISVLVLAQISTFADNNIDDFGTILRYSRLVAAIDAAHTSVMNNETTLSAYKKLKPDLNRLNNISTAFGMSLKAFTPVNGSVFPVSEGRCLSSDTYTSSAGTCFLTDDGSGGVWTAATQNLSIRLLTKIGTIDYDAGKLTLSNWDVQNFNGTAINLYAITAEQDIAVPKSTILQIETSQISITVYEERD